VLLKFMKLPHQTMINKIKNLIKKTIKVFKKKEINGKEVDRRFCNICQKKECKRSQTQIRILRLIQEVATMWHSLFHCLNRI